MLWRVTLVACSDGSEPSEEFTRARGIVIEDRRSGAADLIREANNQWGTISRPGEVYDITPLRDTTRYRVINDAGHLEPLA